MNISKEVIEPNGFKVEAKHKRTPTEREYYCLELGHCISHLLTVIQQLEHTVLYMGNFSPSEKMKQSSISRHSHLLWSTENYLIRTQTSYDRLLIVIDRLFNLQNEPQFISHESIVTNVHIKRTRIPSLLKTVRKSIKKYYHDRNTIIHQRSFLEDNLHAIEAYTILTSVEDQEYSETEHLKEDLKWNIRDYVKKKKREFTRINYNLLKSLAPLFDEAHKIYERKYKQL